MNASTLTVNNGAVASVGGGSLLRVTGDLFQVLNGGTLRTLKGPLLNVAGSSVVNVSGSFIAFGGTGGNTVSVTNGLCPCTLFSGIPVALTGGATSSNVSIGPNPIKNSTLGTVTKSNPVTTSGGTALIVVNGASSKVTITAP